MPGLIYLLAWLAAWSIPALILMGVDKSRAIRHRWRIPERTFFALAVLGGAIGIIVGMLVFRHKTNHRSFTVGVPLIGILQLILAGYLLYRFF
jgi:uncharacterized membrane protein YsdA (DUF1294 family)